jgi:MFS family permease
LRRWAEEQLASFDKKMLLKLDLVLVPMTAMLFLLGFLDRGNIGNTRVVSKWRETIIKLYESSGLILLTTVEAGLQADLGLTDLQYETGKPLRQEESTLASWPDDLEAIIVTYVPYIVAELPSNLLLRKVGPRILLPFLCTAWGIVTTLQSQVRSYAGLIACRFFIGLMEGGLFPGIVLYLSGFYRRHELQVRLALFYSAASLSGAFSGLLAAAIENMNGIGNLRGWQWIFCLEGLVTFAFGVFSFFILPNTPQQVYTFTPEQAARCVKRLQNDVEFPESEKVSLKAVLSVFKSLHLWLQFISLFCSGVCLYGMAYFTPSIVQGLGYGSTQTQLMTVPPFISAFIVTMITAYLADRYRQRGIAAIVTWTIAMVGIILFYKGRSIAVRYLSLFFLITGVYATAPSLICWIPNSTAAHTRRATAIAFAFICTNAGGIVSTWIFPETEAPYYSFAAKFILAIVVIGIVVVAATRVQLKRLNERKENREFRDKVLETVESLDLAEQIEVLGDLHPEFRYTY